MNGSNLFSILLSLFAYSSFYDFYYKNTKTIEFDVGDI